MRRLAAALLLAMAAAGSGAAPAAVTVRDDSGATVRLTQPAKRIVSLAPHATELLFAAGAGERMVAVTEYSDVPPEAARLPRVGGGGGLDLEAIVARRPDLVVAWGSGNPAAQIEQLRALGLNVFVSEPRRLEDIPAAIERFGALAGSAGAASAIAAQLRARQAQLQARYAARPPVRVFHQIWDQPLMTVNGRHLISDVLRLCGGANVFATLPALSGAVSEEAVLEADPEAIVVATTAAEEARWLAAWRRWPRLTAVVRGNLFAIPADLLHRPTPRVLDGAERLCAALETARGRRPTEGPPPARPKAGG
ncbi:MAG: cobalamin-binding protein [Betaproteobacteria bacterium]|nr:cobalamin-binding protein [Betaproteobacteria bacterium]